MLDLQYLDPAGNNTQMFVGGWNSLNERVWHKPRGKSMAHIILAGGGGGGGTGAIGTTSGTAGGGGGGSGGLTVLMIPLALLPDELLIFLGVAGAVSSIYVTDNSNAANCLAFANYGGSGGNGVSGTPGSGGTVAAAATVANMPLGWAFATAFSGQAGALGSANVSLPTTGLIITGAAGGAALPASGPGIAGAGILGSGVLPSVTGGDGGATATTPPGIGNGRYAFGGSKLPLFFYGGTGGGSTYSPATGAGLVQAKGGDGAPGCGGGGGGAAYTGSTAGLGGQGGAGFCIITCW